MRVVSQQARDLIADGGFNRVWVADLMYNGDRLIPNVPIREFEPRWDGGSFVSGSARTTVVWSDDFGTSAIPYQVGDVFSPFGAELQVDCIITAGSFAERIPIGRFVIEEVPRATESNLAFNGRVIHPGEAFEVLMKDSLLRVVRDKFPFPTSPSSSSAWEEAQNLTGLPITRNLVDVSIPAGVTYDEDRAKALQSIFDVLGGWPRATATGGLTARPKRWPASLGEMPGVVSAPHAMTAAETYNRVVVEGRNSNGDPVYGVAEITSGPLRVRNRDGSASPFGGATAPTYKNPLLSTVGSCTDYANEMLNRVSRLRSITRTVTSTFNPLIEVGDVYTIDGAPVRVTDVAMPGNQTVCKVEVPDD